MSNLKEEARKAAETVKNELTRGTEVKTAIILGTGWHKMPRFLRDCKSKNLVDISEFSNLPAFQPNHKDKFLYYGCLDDKPILMINRLHLYEGLVEWKWHNFVRLHIEMLFYCGVRNLILTCGVGSLPNSESDGPITVATCDVDDVVIATDLITTCAPPIGFFQLGEFFTSPNDTISQRLVQLALKTKLPGNRRLLTGKHIMVSGPYFEGRGQDKKNLSRLGADVVGMSILPEACVASIYKYWNVEVLPLCFVTNSWKEEHSDQINRQRGEEASVDLANYLKDLVVAL